MDGSGYQPFPIYDMKSGMHLDKKPWLLPKDGFKKLTNAYLYQGVLNKRKGYEEFGRIVHFVTGETIASGNGVTKTFNGTLDHYPIRAGDLYITSSTDNFTDDGEGHLIGDPGGLGTINYTTGDWTLSFATAPTGPIFANYNYFPGHPVMGIFNYYTNVGNAQLLGFDTKRVNLYNTSTHKFEDVTEQDEWTGGDDNFIWTENWKNRMFITNNKDRVKSYDGEDLTDLLMDIDGDEVNEVDTCLLLFAHKDRLIALRTIEDSTLFAQRARGCKPGNPDIWDEADGGWYADAPTIDWIMGAEFIGDDLVVWFERSIWMLKYTGNPTYPFRWQKIPSEEGCYAPFSIVPFADEILAMGATSLLGCDGFKSYPIDEKIPDLMLEANPQKIQYTYGTPLEELRQNWWLYTSQNSSVPDRALVLNYLENSWSVYDIALRCLGYYSFEEDPILDDIEETFDELEITFDEKTMMAGYPITLGGDGDGYIYHLNKGGSDNGANIELEIESGRWNPYIEQGQRARAGYIDFLVDRDPGITVYIDFYINQMNTPYRTKTLTFDSELSSEEKVWKRVNWNVVGNFHRIKIYHDAKNQTPAIHAIVPYFKPSGRMI